MRLGIDSTGATAFAALWSSRGMRGCAYVYNCPELEKCDSVYGRFNGCLPLHMIMYGFEPRRLDVSQELFRLDLKGSQESPTNVDIDTLILVSDALWGFLYQYSTTVSA